MRCPLLLVLFCLLATRAPAQPQTIFLVRHAERADADGVAQSDPGLSAPGRDRAAALAETLRDAKIEAIYVTEYRRTQETAQPVAEKLGLQAKIVPAKDTLRLVALVNSCKGNVLVIGHSNTLPEIMEALGVASPPAIGEKDYDDLFLLTHHPEVHLLRLHR